MMKLLYMISIFALCPAISCSEDMDRQFFAAVEEPYTARENILKQFKDLADKNKYNEFVKLLEGFDKNMLKTLAYQLVDQFTAYFDTDYFRAIFDMQADLGLTTDDWASLLQGHNTPGVIKIVLDNHPNSADIMDKLAHREAAAVAGRCEQYNADGRNIILRNIKDRFNGIDAYENGTSKVARFLRNHQTTIITSIATATLAALVTLKLKSNKHEEPSKTE